MKRIVKYVLIDIVRNKIIIMYAVFLLVVSLSVFNLEDNSAKGLLSLLNLILFIVPLVSIIFSTIYIYNSSEFIELLLSQPLRRKNIWLSFFAGLCLSLLLAFLVGCGIPILVFERTPTGLMMIGMGSVLTIIFISIAFVATVFTRDKAKGIGAAIFLWLFFSLLYDGLVLFLLFQLADYPLEKLTLVLSALNPVDMGRILLLIKMDVSALMGYTGAVFKQFFGFFWGTIAAIIVLALWAIVPFYVSLSKFKKMDL
jgi:Cu-processing system permease protein